MRACINDSCGDFDDWQSCPESSACGKYASYTVTVKFLPLNRSTKEYTYFTNFKPQVGETLIRVGKEVLVRSFRSSSGDAKYFVERPNTDNEYKPENKTMDEFSKALTKAKTGRFTTKIDSITESAKETASRTGTTIKRVKVGRLAIAAIKSALRKTPGLPVLVKGALDSEYADVVIGAIVPIILPSLTDNARAIKLGEDIAIAGGVAIADKLTFIDDFVIRIMDEIGAKVGESKS